MLRSPCKHLVLMFGKTKSEKELELSKSSRFNLRFMRRTNMLAIVMAVGGILIKVIVELF